MYPDDSYVVWNDEYRLLGEGDSLVVVDRDNRIVLSHSSDLEFAIRSLVRQYRGSPRPWPRQMRWLRRQSRRRGNGWLRLLDQLIERRIVERAEGSDYFSGEGFHALVRRPGAEDLVFVYRGNWNDGVDGVDPFEFSRACGLDRCHLVALRDEGETFYTQLTEELTT